MSALNKPTYNCRRVRGSGGYIDEGIDRIDRIYRIENQE